MHRARRALALAHARRRCYSEGKTAVADVQHELPLRRSSGRVLGPTEPTVSFAAASFAAAVSKNPVTAAVQLRDVLRKDGAVDRLSPSEAFDLVDHNRDGVLTRLEFENALARSFSFNEAVKDIHAATAPPSFGTIAKVAAVSSIPFVGFGFCDNSIMILSGDAIQEFGGAALGLSVMAAAGLGNMVSDVLGIGISGSIERTCVKMGLRPALSSFQMAMPTTQWSISLGRCLGIAVGCMLGMFPLLLDDRFKGPGAAAAAAAPGKREASALSDGDEGSPSSPAAAGEAAGKAAAQMPVVH